MNLFKYLVLQSIKFELILPLKHLFIFMDNGVPWICTKISSEGILKN